MVSARVGSAAARRADLGGDFFEPPAGARASAYKAMWRDKGRAKKKRAPKTEPARIRLPLPKAGVWEKKPRKIADAHAAYAAAPVRFFEGDDGSEETYRDFGLPIAHAGATARNHLAVEMHVGARDAAAGRDVHNSEASRDVGSREFFRAR